MDKIEFEIFEPDGKKFHLTSNWLIFFLWILTILPLFFLSNDYMNSIKTIICIWVGTVAAISIFLMINSYFAYMPLFGKLNGELVFENGNIIINGKTFKLSEINDIDFVINDFYGKYYRLSRDFNPKYAQGVDNYISFTDNLNQMHIIRFKLATEHHYESLSPFINDAVKAKKIQFNKAADIIGIENVSIDPATPQN